MDPELIDIDEMNEVVINGIICAANLAIPVFSNNKKFNKSLPEYILNLIKARKLARKAKKKEKNGVTARRNYNQLTKLIRCEIQALKDSEWSEFIHKMDLNPQSTKPFWRRIATIKGKKQSKSFPIRGS
jgi:hypothetical protein